MFSFAGFAEKKSHQSPRPRIEVLATERWLPSTPGVAWLKMGPWNQYGTTGALEDYTLQACRCCSFLTLTFSMQLVRFVHLVALSPGTPGLHHESTCKPRQPFA